MFDEPTETYIIILQSKIPWGWQRRRVLAIKGKTPGSKPRDLSHDWAFFSASCVLEGYECQSSGDSSELPGYLNTSLPALSTTLLQYLHSPRHWSPAAAIRRMGRRGCDRGGDARWYSTMWESLSDPPRHWSLATCIYLLGRRGCDRGGGMQAKVRQYIQ